MALVKKEERYKYRSTGQIYEIKSISNQFVILHSVDGLAQVMTEKQNLTNSFEKIPERTPQTSEVIK